jgi:ketosteroid isomerase-like protein
MQAAIGDIDTEFVRDRVNQLVEYVEAGRVFEAIREFYADGVAMTPGTQPPMFGLEAHEHRDGLLAAVTEWRGFRIKGLGVNGDTSFVECALDFESADGDTVSMDQVAVATWRNGKIVSERFLPMRALD